MIICTLLLGCDNMRSCTLAHQVLSTAIICPLKLSHHIVDFTIPPVPSLPKIPLIYCKVSDLLLKFLSKR